MSRRAPALALVVLVVLGPATLGAAAGPAKREREPVPANLLVTAVEYRLQLSRASVPTGAAAIQLVDKGEDPHDLALRRIDAHGHLVGPQLSLPQATPGNLTHRTLHLAPGRWKLWCTLPGHERLGMRAVLSVRHAVRR
jgi:hypothetical protein